MKKLYAEHCNRSYEEFELPMDRDRFISVKKALQWGLVDCILTVPERSPM